MVIEKPFSIFQNYSSLPTHFRPNLMNVLKQLDQKIYSNVVEFYHWLKHTTYLYKKLILAFILVFHFHGRSQTLLLWVEIKKWNLWKKQKNEIVLQRLKSIFEALKWKKTLWLWVNCAISFVHITILYIFNFFALYFAISNPLCHLKKPPILIWNCAPSYTFGWFESTSVTGFKNSFESSQKNTRGNSSTEINYNESRIWMGIFRRYYTKTG